MIKFRKNTLLENSSNIKYNKREKFINTAQQPTTYCQQVSVQNDHDKGQGNTPHRASIELGDRAKVSQQLLKKNAMMWGLCLTPVVVILNWVANILARKIEEVMSMRKNEKKPSHLGVPLATLTVTTPIEALALSPSSIVGQK